MINFFQSFNHILLLSLGIHTERLLNVQFYGSLKHLFNGKTQQTMMIHYKID